MSYLDKYHLDKSSKKYLCPQCGKKRFVVYLDTESGQPVNEHAFGRCDREAECGYHVKPDATKKKKDSDVYVVTIIHPKEEKLKEFYERPTNLHKFLATNGIPESHLYKCGVFEDRGLTVYVFRRLDNKLANFKWFKYGTNGKRDHDFDSYSLKQPEQRNKYIEEKYTMCLFMEHLLDPDKKKIVCVVESEKTAAIASFVYPEFDWVACGSASGLSDGSEGTADKITPLKGRTVYWVGDADKASRGKMMFNERSGQEEFVWCSSIRNGIKYIDDFHVVDLWPNREDGHDIGDAILEGQKPEIVPTWSKKAQDVRLASYVPPDMKHMLREFDQGKDIGESAVVEQLSENFSWKRSFVNCWTGWPNDGKSTFFSFMAITKSVPDKWKWCFWPPEMINSYKDGKLVKISANDIYDELIFMYTGKNPYLHFQKKYNVPQMPRDEYMAAAEWVRKHFFVIYPKERKYKSLIENYYFMHEYFGCDGYLADPFKSFAHDDQGRTDLYLDTLFYDFKAMAIDTNTVMNFIAHPKTQEEPKNKDGTYKVCNHHMLAGGASWNNNMDGIYSVYRQNRHNNPTDPKVTFFNLKQRKQELTARVGKYDKIEFDFFKHRYYFDGVCPVDGSPMPEKIVNGIPAPVKQGTKSGLILPFEEHIMKDWGQSPTPEPPVKGGPDDPPF